MNIVQSLEDTKLQQAKVILNNVKMKAQPKVLIELNRLVKSDDVDFEEVSDLVSQDVGLSAKLLKLASSPVYSKGQTFCTVHEALLTIGLQEFQIYFTTAALGDLMGKVSYPYQGFLEHSRRVALFCREIARIVDPKYANNAYTLGLFHDVGAVLIPVYHQKYAEHIHRALPLHFGITEAEFNLVKTNHCAVGELFTRNWGIETEILKAIRYHHRVDFDPSWSEEIVTLKSIIQLAELMNDKITSGSDQLAPFSTSEENLLSICSHFDLKYIDLKNIEFELVELINSELVEA